MDILNLWNDDPEEVLLDLGFGCDEPDLSGRIPARFINHPSQARGINLQVFLEAQKNRLDLENPDVSNRFRELEVLQQVTTAFSSLVGSSSSPLRAPQGKDVSPEAHDRRQRMGMLFRRASKKSLSQIHNNKTQDLTSTATSTPCAAPESLRPPSPGDKTVLLKRVKPELQEIVHLSPLAEEQGAGPDPEAQPHVASLIAQEGAHRPWPLKEAHPPTANTFSQRRKSPGQVRESFELEEINSFEESNVTGSYTGGTEKLVQGVVRTNSCQSDSSGFLEIFIPSLSQQASPGFDLIKAQSALSGGSTDSPSSERPGSLLIHSSLTSSKADKSLLPKSVLQISQTEKLQDQGQCPPAGSVYECLPPCCSSPELQNVIDFQSSTLPSSASVTLLSPTSSPLEPASLIRGSEVIRTEDMDAPSPHLTTLSRDSEGTVYSIFSSTPPDALSTSAPNLDYPFSASTAMSSTRSDSSSGTKGNTKSEWTEVVSHENSLSAYDGSSSMFLNSPYLPPYIDPDFHFPSSKSLPFIECLSQSLENDKKDSLLPGADEIGLPDAPTNTHKKEEETPFSLSFQLDKDSSSVPPSLILNSSNLKKGCTSLPCLSHNSSSSISQSALSLQLHDSDGLIDPDVGRISDQIEHSICQQDRPCSHHDNTDPAVAPPVQNTQVKMDNLSLDSEDTLQINGEWVVKGDGHTDTVEPQGIVVYNSDTENCAGLSESSRLVSKNVCNQTEIDPQIIPHSLHELPTENKPEKVRKVSQMGMNGTESESPRSYLVLHDDIREAWSRTEGEPKDLIEIDCLDLVFQTSVDGSEGENEDVDAFFQQLDTEGRVYWAEPIQVSNLTPVLEESGSFEASDGSPGNSLLPRDSADPDSFSFTGRAMPLSVTSSTTMDTDRTSVNATASLTLGPFPSSSKGPELKPPSRSVSVQMSSSLSSHIVHRRDIPYMTDSKRTLIPSVLPLDTSTPFRAVQSWTDLQIQRNALTKNLSHGALNAVPNKVTVSMSASEMTERPTFFSSSPSFPLLSNNDLPGMARNYSTVSVSVDKLLWPDEEEEVDGNENEDEKFWEGTAAMAHYYTCGHHCTCCGQKNHNKQHTLGNILYSLDELEEMMLCLQQFCSVLSDMEMQLSEDQAAVYSVLSDQDREKVRDIEELRRAVKQEAGELEMQLNELAHHYDDSLKMKMQRLLDEQSLLCSQLRVFQPGMASTSLSPAPKRTVATQCCLLPWIPPADVRNGHASSCGTWNVDSPRQSPPGSESMCKGLGCWQTSWT